MAGPVAGVGRVTARLPVRPPLLAEGRRPHPELDLKITGGSADRSIAMLRSGIGDLGLVTLPVEASDLVSVPVLKEELLLITYPTHPLARKREIRAHDLAREPFILFEAGSITRRLVDEFFAREHLEPQIVMENENAEIIKAMVRHGLGISIIPWQAAQADVQTKQLHCSRIAGHALFRQTGWLYPKMRRLPRAVAEVMRVFEQIRPQFDATVRAPRNY